MSEDVQQIIDNTTFRRNIYNMVPEGASRILDFGCGNGALLLRLKQQKQCEKLFGVEISPKETRTLAKHITKVWNINIENDFSQLEKMQGFFNYIILHDVIEHLYDPWHTLTKIRSLLSKEGQILIATPNFHHWRLQYEILSGHFPYGPGLWHTGHLRWYTPSSLVELLVIAGLKINEIFLEIPDNVNFTDMTTAKEIKEIEIPPKAFQGDKRFQHTYSQTFPEDIKSYYPVFFAHKLIADCGKGELIVEPAPMTYNCPRLAAIREAIQLPFNIFNPPPMTQLIGNWR